MTEPIKLPPLTGMLADLPERHKEVIELYGKACAIAAPQSQKPEPNNLMLSAVIRMPFEMAMADPISRMQFYQRAQQALNELEALQSQGREDAPFLQEDDQHALYRFIETAEDGEGYDIGKDRIKRLAELGVVSNHGFGRYSVTMFGHWCHEKHWHQNPSLPLKTIGERNAQAAIDQARCIEGDGEW
jgi:hypothetical protein